MQGINNSQEGNFNMFTPEELIYTEEEMERGLRIKMGNGESFGDLTEKSKEELKKSLKERQKFKDNNDPLKGDLYQELRKAHRPDLLE